MADDNVIQVFLDKIREIVPNQMMRIGATTDGEDYKKPSEFKGNKVHRLEVRNFGRFTGTEEEILAAVQAKAAKRAELEA